MPCRGQDKHQTRHDGAQEHVAGAGRGDAELRGHDELTGRGLVSPPAAAVPAWSVALESWSARMISTIDGGMIWPSVPAAADGPGRELAASSRCAASPAARSGPWRPRWRRECRWWPPAARRRAPPRCRDRPEPARRGCAMVTSRSSAIFERCSMMPMNTNRGIGDQGVALDLPVDAAEVGDAGGEPLYGRPPCAKIGAGVAGEEVAARARRADGQDGRAGQRERHRVARCQGPGHEPGSAVRERRVPRSGPARARVRRATARAGTADSRRRPPARWPANCVIMDTANIGEEARHQVLDVHDRSRSGRFRSRAAGWLMTDAFGRHADGQDGPAQRDAQQYGAPRVDQGLASGR